MYAHLYINYGKITNANLKDARLGITVQFEFATLPMEQYLFKVRKCQQLHGNAIPPRPITDKDAMGIVYLNLQRSGLYPLDCREWKMSPANLKKLPLLRATFVSAERRPRAYRGMGVPQGLANNLKDLQRAGRIDRGDGPRTRRCGKRQRPQRSTSSSNQHIAATSGGRNARRY